MKNYIIGFLLVVILVLISLDVKKTRSPIMRDFPVMEESEGEHSGDPVLQIYVYFSMNDCADCLEFISVLDNLPSQFNVVGIVSQNELAVEADIRAKTGARFPLIALSNAYSRFFPSYSPSIYGVGKNGKVYFVIPGVPGEKDYLEYFLISLYGRILPHLIKEN